MNKTKEVLEQEQKRAIDRYSASINNDIYTGMKKTLEEYEKRIQEYKNELEKNDLEIGKLKKLKECYTNIKDIVAVDNADNKTLLMIDSADADTESVINAITNLRNTVDKSEKSINKEFVHIEDKEEELNQQQEEVAGVIRELKNEIITYPADAARAKEILTEEFKKIGLVCGKDLNIRFLSELVSEIKDLRWQKAIETFLGNKRFHIIVDSKYAFDAMKILKSRKIYNATVAMTNKLPESDITPGSAASLFVVPNADARKYMNYLLNGIHLCENLEELNDYPKGGLTREGMLAKSYAVRWI